LGAVCLHPIFVIKSPRFHLFSKTFSLNYAMFTLLTKFRLSLKTFFLPSLANNEENVCVCGNAGQMMFMLGGCSRSLAEWGGWRCEFGAVWGILLSAFRLDCV
jgi:hypothetical protein